MNREVTLLKSEQHADIIIRPSIFDINFKDINNVSLSISRGEQATKEKLSEIKKLVGK